MIVNMDGARPWITRPMARLYVSVTAEKDGVVQSNGSNIARAPRLRVVLGGAARAGGARGVDRTMILFEARRPPAGELPVILAAGASGILLHEAIGHGLEADFNRKGTSIYSTMIGDRIAPEFVHIIDDGTIDHARGASTRTTRATAPSGRSWSRTASSPATCTTRSAPTTTR